MNYCFSSQTFRQAKAIYLRNYFNKYSGMKLHYIWLLLMPCLPLFLYNMLSMIGIFKESEIGLPRAISVSLGIIVYNLFADTFVGITNALEENQNFINKIGVSFKACYISTLMSVYSDFIIRMVVFSGILFVYKIYNIQEILWISLLSIVPVLYGLCVGLTLSILNVFFKDIRNIVQTIAFYMLFASGVFGAVKGETMIERWVSELPTYILVTNARNILTGADLENHNKLIITITISIVTLLISIFGVRNTESLTRNYLR